jgi:iron(III) transport system ATP-binding protein
MSIEVRNLRRNYGDTIAVAGVDLEIAEGEMLVLLGPSGCGKTTIMRCIAGLDNPQDGRISIGGRVVYDPRQGINVPANKRNVGMVFQSYAIWPHMTVRGNVGFPLEMAGRDRAYIQKRVPEILALVALSGFEDRGASYLSGGQMQRVALARSLAMEPSVLLFDEPLSNLDAQLRESMRTMLRELQTQLGITSVYVTHDQREGLALADKIVVMNKGRVEQVADPVTLYRNPRTATIADFLGYSNVFDVDAVTDRRGSTLATLDGGVTLLAGSPAPTGAKLAACVRPNDVSIAPAGERQPAENTMAGDVQLVSFVGSHMLYRVKVSEKMVWEVLSSEVTAGLRIGARVALTVAPRNVLLLPRD